MASCIARRARLGFAVGAFCFAAAAVARAQVVPPPASEVPIPPKPRTDSTAPKHDTIQPPFGRSTGPRTADVGDQYSWDRTELLASGALTVADILERIPGATSFRTGWLISPKVVAVNGDAQRVRMFYDDLELDNLDPRSGTVLDLTSVQLWTLESLAVERLGNELRVHLRSWRVDRTSPYTRTDVYTGDEDSNVYRGYYGKRFSSGAGIQLAGQQFSTTAARLGGGGDALSFMGRVGVARRRWSVDAFAARSHHTRVLQPTFGSGLSIPEFDGTWTLAYLRAAVGSHAGVWGQFIASSRRLVETSGSVSQLEASTRRVISDTTDTTTSRPQYVLSGGWTRGPLSLVATHRIRAGNGNTSHSPQLRAEFFTSALTAAVSAERNGFSGIRRGDAVFRFTPFKAAAFAGAIARVSSDSSLAGSDGLDWTEARIEAGVRLVRSWISLGVITRDTGFVAALPLFDTAYVARAFGTRRGEYVALRGRIYQDLGVDLLATRWEDAGPYRPEYQTRSEVNLITSWLSRFPSGNFGLKAVFVFDHRSPVEFPLANGSRIAVSSGIASALLEIRIMRGVISYQVRNLVGRNHQIVPDFFMPRAINIYGVRWEFWN